ncbi:MAG: alanine racemase [Acidimicrobiales bacterium]|nr:alanine racemase [Acidimicrobiales bacterium]
MSLARPRLTVRLGAIATNYGRIGALCDGVQVGAAVKADAYGLGIEPVARTLWTEGCREFFVASVEEGVELRAVLPEAAINVFHGVVPGTAADLVLHDLTPVVISAEQLDGWRAAAGAGDRALPVGLHLDTGMNRTGMPESEVEELRGDAGAFAGLEVRHILSHLASADDPESDQPERQLARFRSLLPGLPGGVVSLANSAGAFRGPDFRFDLVRPGIALFGGSPVAGEPSPLEPTVVLEAPVLQIRDLQPGDEVGYGATYRVERPERHAVVPVGYADGFPRSASNRGGASVAGHRVPVVGRVSMDLTILDVTEVPREALDTGVAEMVGDNVPVDEVAAAADTISYEILTSLGRRYERVYVD